MVFIGLLAPTIPTAAGPEAQSSAIPWWLFAIVVLVVVGAGAALLLVAMRKQKPAEMPCPNCGKVMMPDWPKCMFCKMPRGFHKAALQFVSGPMAGKTIALDGEVTTIGSAPGSTVTLRDAGVSRKHAGIRRVTEGDGPGYELADLGSTNGVYVNGEKVAKKRLQLGDVIRVGASEMVFK